jgi:predicted SprT family Zn-dependent metalloprotease
MSHTCCVVELSSKVIDNQERLESVLLHELCHVAAFLIDNETKPPHGSAFRKWGARGFDKLGIEVTTCHSFDIHTPHKFKCTNFDCGQMYGRHSKKGINVDIKVCGSCNNPLQYVGVFDADGTVILFQYNDSHIVACLTYVTYSHINHVHSINSGT